jgi:hypothetical protein
MLVRDLRTGRLVAVPDGNVFVSPPGRYPFGPGAPGSVHGLGGAPGFGHYGAAPGQIIYDGLGHPLGLPFLTALPAIIGKVAAFLPQIASVASKVLPFLQGAGATPQGQPAPTQAPNTMVQPSMQPPVQPSMQPPMQPPMPSPMESPIQPTMTMLAPMAASMQPPIPPQAWALREEVAVAPMRVQTPGGETFFVARPVRRRRRRHGRGSAQIAQVIPPRPLSPAGFAPELAAPPHTLQGWFGFNNWRDH